MMVIEPDDIDKFELLEGLCAEILDEEMLAKIADVREAADANIGEVLTAEYDGCYDRCCELEDNLAAEHIVANVAELVEWCREFIDAATEIYGKMARET